MIYVPLYIHVFQFLHSKRLTDAQIFNLKYPNSEIIPTTAEKLRYYRHKNSLLQREVAEYAGIDMSTYIRYENPKNSYCPLDKLQRFADMFKINIIMLLDEYHRFLYNGQGRQIKLIRKQLKMTQQKFSECIGVPIGTLKKWEQEKVKRISHETFKYLTR